MKSAVFYGKKDLRVEERAPREPDEGEVMIRVRACGICGTDVHIFNGDEGAAKTPANTVLGHEFSGEVVSVGKNVGTLSVGDRVCVDPNVLCGKCKPCLEGLGHFCEDMTGIGTTVDGGFSEYCTVLESAAHKFSDNIPFESAAMCEPVSCCLHGIEMCDIRPGDTVAVIGCGMIGLLMLQLARLSGASKIIAIEPVAEKRDAAAKLGADICFDPAVSSAEEIKKEVGRISCVIECAGRTETMENAIALAGYKSTVMMFGLTAPGDTISVKPFEIFKKEITLRASFINPYTFGRALSLISSGKIDVSSMIYKYEPLEKLPAILSDPGLRRGGKIIIRP